MPPADAIRSPVNRGEIIINGWASLGSAYGVELLGRAGCGMVTIDQQHGVGGNAELLACLTAARAAGVPALVRVAANDFHLIGRALDAGAQGVICPLINSVADAKALVEAVKYPPLGGRSWGPYRARLLAEGDYFDGANDWTIACGQIETAAALSSLDAILAVPGFDMLYVGPNDLAITLSGGAHRDVKAPEVLAALDRILASARAHGVIAGVFANDADYARPLIAKGWQVVTIGTDAVWLGVGAAAACRALRG